MENYLQAFLLAGGVLYLLAIIGTLWGPAKMYRFYLYGNTCSLMGNICFFIGSLIVIFKQADFSLAFKGPLDWITIVLRFDRLSGFFMFTLSLLAVIICLYSFGYKHLYHRGTAVFQQIFMFSMVGLLAAYDILSFLFFWELMSFSSYFLIVADYLSTESRKSGFLYLIMTQFGAALLLLTLSGIAAFNRSLDFRQLTGAAIPEGFQVIFQICLLVGFGTKAGLVPLHIWLPKAHPAAPTPASALLSGFMIKLALYGILRFIYIFEAEVWLGSLMVALGLVSAFLGVLYAYMENDFKKLLAFCSIENMGILILVAGVYQWGRALHNELLIGMGLATLEFHLLNHALFKGLLFLVAGAVVQECKTRNMERLGGLIKRMPRTAFFALIGSLAGAGLPVTSGFISEWLIFQTLFGSGAMLASPILKMMTFLGTGVLALTSGLAAATFVKFFGMTFLALPRSPQPLSAKEVNLPMSLGMGLAATLIVALGVFPWLGWKLIVPAVQWRGNLPFFSAIPLPEIFNFKNYCVPFFTVLALAFFAGAVGPVLINPQRRSRTGPTWNCGLMLQPRMEYGPSSFAKMGRLVFRFLLRPKRNIIRNFEKHKMFVSSLEYQSDLPSHFEEKFYRPGTKLILLIAEKLRLLQTGNIKLYLGYILGILMAMLIYARQF